jgi:hypothetical protein
MEVTGVTEDHGMTQSEVPENSAHISARWQWRQFTQQAEACVGPDLKAAEFERKWQPCKKN